MGYLLNIAIKFSSCCITIVILSHHPAYLFMFLKIFCNTN